MKIPGWLKGLAGTALFAVAAGTQAGPITINGFTGSYAPDQWTAAVTGDGFVDTINAPDSVSLVCYDECSIDLTIVSDMIDATVGFSWDVFTWDAFDAPATLGFLLNGVFTEIVTVETIDPAVFFLNETGSSVFNVDLGDVFGFRLSCAWCDGAFFDQADAVISGFTITGVPEPGTLALLSLGLLGAGAMRRRRIAA